MAHNLDDKVRTKDVLLEEDVTFSSLLLPKHILNSLTKCGFRKPSPIQLKAIPVGRCGFDLIVQSKSGTGKTIVFAIVALEMVNVTKSSLQCLVLAPTREIAVQIQDVIRNIGCELDGLKVECFIGGTPYELDKQKAANCHIAVGAPGRIKHLITDGVLKTDAVRLFVLDEADKLMESSFQSDINDIYLSLSKRKQMLAISATYENNLVEFLSKYMLSPTYITANIETPMLLGLKHFVLLVKSFASAIPQMKVKNERLNYILHNVRYTQCIIFSNYQTRAESLLSSITRNKLECGYISAAQSQENRLKVLDDFKHLKLRILSSTDLTARGIDASGVDLIINYDVPIDAMTYLHRMGRAGRFGSEGICINIVSEGEEFKRFSHILGTIGGTKLSAPILETLQIDVNLNTLDLGSLEHLYGQIPETVNLDIKTDIKNEVFKLKQNKTNSGNKPKRVKTKKTAQESVDISQDIKGSNDGVCVQGKSDDPMLDADCINILQQLAEGKTDIVYSSSNKNNDEDFKKRKRCNNESLESLEYSHDSHINKLKTQDENLCKNMALLNTTKLLFSDSTSGEICDDIVDSIGDYLKLMKEKDNSLYISEPMDTTSSEEKTQDVSEVPSVSSQESMVATSVKQKKQDARKKSRARTFCNLPVFDIPDNILCDAYDSIMSPNGKSWKDHISESEVSKFETYMLEKEAKKHSVSDADEYCEDEDEDMYYEDEVYEEYYDDDEEVDEEYLKFKQSRDYAAEVASQPTLEWVPVKEEESVLGNEPTLEWLPIKKEESVVGNECQTYQASAQYSESQLVPGRSKNYFDACFQVCSDELWNNGLNFNNIQHFNNWFHQWQSQVQEVRDYVQQSVYVDEMNRYRYSRSYNQ